MKILIITFLVLFNLTSFGQKKDTLIIGKRVFGDIPCWCDNNERDCLDRNLTNEDSLYQCRYTLTFLTNNNNYLYQKEYNLKDTLVAEGTVINRMNKKRFMRKQTYSFYKYGTWKEYDYKEGIIRIKRHIVDFCPNEIMIYEETIDEVKMK